MLANRRSATILLAVILCLATAEQGQARKAAATAAKTRPNVLLITIDTLRADHLGCYGYKNVKTPNIDALGADGARFANAYSAVPTTLPSHSTILTGTYPMLHGMHDFSGNKLNQSQPTLATLFKAQGYATGAVVAAAVLDSRFGLNNGFDFYFDNFDFSRLAETNLDSMERPGNLVVDEALRWLQHNRAHPFFLWVHLYDPHHPYTPPEPYASEYRNNPYDGEIAFADAQVGRMLQFLKVRGLYANTTILLAGDHGEGLGEHGEKTHGFFIYNSTMHVPLILKPARSGGPRRVVEQPVSLVDVAPTLLASSGIPSVDPIQGKSLLPLLQANTTIDVSAAYNETYLPRLHFNWSELRGLAYQKYHFIDGPKPELYDLSTDPKELTNLYEMKPAVSAELRNRLAGVIRAHTPESELAEKTSLDPAMAERLKALGYAAVSSGSTATLSDKNLPDPKDRIETYELISGAIEDSQHGRYDESIAKLTTAAKTETESVPVHYLLALNYYRKQQFVTAQEQFNKVLKLSPDYSLAAYYLALAYGRTKDWDNAIQWFERALQLDPTNHQAAYNLGAAYVQKRDFAAAIAAMQRALRIYPEFTDAYRSLGELLVFQKDFNAGIAALRKAAELEPRDPRNFTALARAYNAQGMMAEAAEAQRTAERLQNGAPR
jgi:arylsulfatase A-like enzyme/Tfp pilus assembly protein PilF